MGITGTRSYVQLLGAARAHTEHRRIDFCPDKRYQLLAYLAYDGGWAGREELSYLFWPDAGTQEARRNLRQLLHRLQPLGWLRGLEAERHRLRWEVGTDVARFRQAAERGRLDQALALYGGPLLRGLDSYQDSEFACWLERERARLHALWRDLTLARAEAWSGEGRHALAAALLRGLLLEDPLDEDALCAYLSAAARAGLRAEALSAYREFAARLRRELALAPAPATARLAGALEGAAPPPPGHDGGIRPGTRA